MFTISSHPLDGSRRVCGGTPRALLVAAYSLLQLPLEFVAMQLGYEAPNEVRSAAEHVCVRVLWAACGVRGVVLLVVAKQHNNNMFVRVASGTPRLYTVTIAYSLLCLPPSA